MVPFFDNKAIYAELKPDLDASYRRVVESGRYVLGQEVEAFEAEYAAFCGTRHCVGVGNGTEALELTLRAWGIGPGDEVIVPSNTYIATWLAVAAAGAALKPVEPTCTGRGIGSTIDPGRIIDAITPRTKAIIPVHLYGDPANMAEIMSIAERHGLKVLEDVAQAQGARAHGRRTGTLGHAGAHSLYPTKNIGAFGDAGVITTDDDGVAERLRRLRNYGSRERSVNLERGLNSRLDELQAAFLRTLLPRLDGWNQHRRMLADRYDANLAGVVGLGLPQRPSWAEPVWHLYVVRIEEGAERRAALMARLAAAGIGCLMHYPIPPHLQPAFAPLGYGKGSFPLAETLADTVLSLPIGPHMSCAAVDEVTNVVRATLDAGR